MTTQATPRKARKARTPRAAGAPVPALLRLSIPEAILKGDGLKKRAAENDRTPVRQLLNEMRGAMQKVIESYAEA